MVPPLGAALPSAMAGMCRVDCIVLPPSTLGSFSRPNRRLNAELLGIFGVQPLPAGELHRIRTGDAAERRSAEQAIQNIEGNMPPGGAHGDEAAVDGAPQRQARAATRGFEFPTHIAVLQHLRRVGSFYGGRKGLGRSYPGEFHS